MGLFGNLFEKKVCDICGGEIGLLGNRKLEDGNCCKECAKKLSPLFSERKSSTIEEIKTQLAYREENKKNLENFTATHTISCDWQVVVDENNNQFIVHPNSKWREANADIIPFSQLTGCSYDVKESRTEEKWKDEEGNSHSYEPPRWDTDYDVYIHINVNNPYFSSINFKANTFRIEDRNTYEFNSARDKAQEVCDLLENARQENRAAVTAAAAPKMAKTCPFCGATTFPDAAGRCEYCGGAMGV